MSNTLGWLTWWRVNDPSRFTHDHLAVALQDVDVPLPKRPIPADVYRRVCSGFTREYLTNVEANRKVIIGLHPVDSTSDKMLVHHIVGTLKEGDAVTSHKKVGEFAFYKPPRGQHSKARANITRGGDGYGFYMAETDRFASELRHEYDTGVAGALDGQAIRRVVRAHLENVKALHLGGPYFTVERCGETLYPLFDMLGNGSFIEDVPFEDTEHNRAILVRALERAVTAGQAIDESLWDVTR